LIVYHTSYFDLQKGISMLEDIVDSFKSIVESFKDDDFSYVLCQCTFFAFVMLLFVALFILIFVIPYAINIFFGITISAVFLLPFAVMAYVRYFKK